MPAYNARVAFNAHNSSSGALITNVVHVEVDTLSSPPNWGSIAGDINTWLGTQWRNILTTHDVFDSIVATPTRILPTFPIVTPRRTSLTFSTSGHCSLFPIPFSILTANPSFL